MGLTNQSGAEYLRQIFRSPVYEAAKVTPLETMPRLSARIGNKRRSNVKIASQYTRLNCAALTTWCRTSAKHKSRGRNCRFRW